MVQQNGASIQKKAGQETDNGESLADSIQRQSEPTIQRFWDDTTHVKLPRVGNILKGTTVVDWTNVVATNKLDKIIVWNQQESDILFSTHHEFQGFEFFIFKDTNQAVSPNAENWWAAYADFVHFNGNSIHDIQEKQQQWNDLNLPTAADTTLSDTDLSKLQEKFIIDKVQFVENVIAGKTGDELKYRLKGCAENNSLEKNVIDQYAAQKIREATIAQRDLEWPTLDLQDPGNAKTNYLQLSDEHRPTIPKCDR